MILWLLAPATLASVPLPVTSFGFSSGFSRLLSELCFFEIYMFLLVSGFDGFERLNLHN